MDAGLNIVAARRQARVFRNVGLTFDGYRNEDVRKEHRPNVRRLQWRKRKKNIGLTSDGYRGQL